MRTPLTKTNIQNITTYAHKACKSLHNAFQQGGTGVAVTLICTIMQNAVGPIHEIDWQEMMQEVSHPCGIDDCQCHLTGHDLFQALDAMREDWIAKDAKIKKERQ